MTLQFESFQIQFSKSLFIEMTHVNYVFLNNNYEVLEIVNASCDLEDILMNKLYQVSICEVIT